VDKRRDVGSSLRGLLRTFGLKIRPIGKAGFAGRIRALVAGQAMLEPITAPLLEARDALRRELAVRHRAVMRLARGGPVRRQPITAPGVGVVVAVTFKSTIDDPTRFAPSRDLGPCLGRVPRRYQPGETDYGGSITRTGDVMLRTALHEAATTIPRMPRRSARRSRAALSTGASACRAGRHAQGQGGAGPQARHRSPSDVGRRQHVSLGGDRHGVVPEIGGARRPAFAGRRACRWPRLGDVGWARP
jgi:transposase